MKLCILIFMMFVESINVIFISKFEIGEKRVSNGYIVACINYRDSLNFSLNSVEYYFVIDDTFSNKALAKIFGDYRDNSKNSRYPYVKRSEVAIGPKENQMAIFREYSSKYSRIISSGGNFNSDFIDDITKTTDDLIYSDSNAIEKVFKSPYIKSRKEFGFFYSIHKVKMSYYTELYPSFDEYEKDFLNSSNDLKSKRFVGLQGTSLGAKLKRVGKSGGVYPVALPVHVVELE